MINAVHDALSREEKKLSCCREVARVSCLSTVQYLERIISLLLLVTAALDLPMRTTKFCAVLFGAIVD